MSGIDSYRIKMATDVLKHDIPALDAEIKRRVQRVIEDRLVIDPVRHGKPLQASLKGHRSIRVGGGYRIVYKIDAEARTVFILAIGKRNDIYSKSDKRQN